MVEGRNVRVYFVTLLLEGLYAWMGKRVLDGEANSTGRGGVVGPR